MGHSVRVGSLIGYPELVEKLGGDPQDLFARCNIPLEAFEDEDNLIPYAKMVELLEITATRLNRSDFGLYLGSLQNADIFGPVSTAIQTAKTVGHAMKSVARFVHIQSPAIHYSIDEQHEDYVRVSKSISLPDLSHREMPQAIDRAIASGQEIWKQLAGTNFKILKIEIPHEPLCPISSYEQYFDAQIEFNTESIAWHIPREIYDSPPPLQSKRLHRFAMDYLTEQYPTQNNQLSFVVEKELRRLIETESCTRDSIAESLALHPKTMQRRLARENSNFDSIRDRVRRERATYYLCNTDIPFKKIAKRVGYGDQAALSRSCQRWFSKSPREVRSENKLAYPTRSYNTGSFKSSGL